MVPRIAVTVGDPAGIGPEISLRASWELRNDVHAVLIGDFAYLSDVAASIDPAMHLSLFQPEQSHGARHPSNRLEVIDCAMERTPVPGKPDAANGFAILRMLDIAVEGAQRGLFDAIVTAPVQKSIINDAGIGFTGHTEYLAEKYGAERVVMMLAGRTGNSSNAYMLRVALATTHLPLKDVAAAITPEDLSATLSIVDSELKSKFGLENPRILVTGLNPHAGEGGYLGREEIDVITPTIAKAQQKGMDVSGPYPADTLFQPRFLEYADCVLAMYHDQGLPVLKYATFGHGVNVTLGLPIIRTSVDHGTALDMAQQGVGHADCGSMIEAIRVAAEMVSNMRKTGASS